MLTLASIVDGHALWKIALAALAGGGGVVIAFSVGLIGLSRLRDHGGALQAGYLALVSVCGALCAGAVGVGIWAMTQK
jgi:hypothetical protein